MRKLVVTSCLLCFLLGSSILLAYTLIHFKTQSQSKYVAAVTSSLSTLQTSVHDTWPTNDASLIVFGDLMLDRGIREKLRSTTLESMLSQVSPLIKSSTFAMANGEGVFSENKSVAIKNHSILRFTFSTSTAPVWLK